VTYRDHKDRSKIVRYWVMNVQSGTFEANEEVDALEWVSPVEAGERLTYDHDVDVLSAFLSLGHDD
jgi:8-oxo-dGTP diphosphatase